MSNYKRKSDDPSEQVKRSKPNNSIFNSDYLQRSIHAATFMSENPLILDKNRIIDGILDYYYVLLTTFFKGCGLSYDKQCIIKDSDSLSVVIYTPFNDNEGNVMFSLFMASFNYIVKDALSNIDQNWSEFDLYIEGSSLWFEFALCDENNSHNLRVYRSIKESNYHVNGEVLI